jgi:HrpA-like RNA helicase
MHQWGHGDQKALLLSCFANEFPDPKPWRPGKMFAYLSSIPGLEEGSHGQGEKCIQFASASVVDKGTQGAADHLPSDHLVKAHKIVAPRPPSNDTNSVERVTAFMQERGHGERKLVPLSCFANEFDHPKPWAKGKMLKFLKGIPGIEEHRDLQGNQYMQFTCTDADDDRDDILVRGQTQSKPIGCPPGGFTSSEPSTFTRSTTPCLARTSERGGSASTQAVSCTLDINSRLGMVHLCRTVGLCPSVPPQRKDASAAVDLIAGVRWAKHNAITEKEKEKDKEEEEQAEEEEEEEQEKQDDENHSKLTWEAPSPNSDFWNCGPDADKDVPAQLRQQLAPVSLPLPIDNCKEQLLATIRQNPVVIVMGPAGCGKSTRLPAFLLEDDSNSCIAVGEPRVLATQMLAERVAEERGQVVGHEVGYFTGDHKNQPARQVGSISYAVYETLYHRLQAVGAKGASHIVLDEVHEWTLMLELILERLRTIHRHNLRSPFRTVLMSATLDPGVLQRYFSPFHVPVVEVMHAPYDVKWHFLADLPSPVLQELDQQLAEQEFERLPWGPTRLPTTEGAGSLKLQPMPGVQLSRVNLQVVVHLIKWLLGEWLQKKMGAEATVLVFLPGKKEIYATMDRLHNNALASNLKVLPLFSELDSDEQRYATDTTFSGKLKIVLASNIAESSVTIANVDVVIDVGLMKLVRGYSLVPEWASKHNIMQRVGRTGRTGPGKAYLLYPRELYEAMLEAPEPEMLRVPLDKVVLGILKQGARPQNLLKFVVHPPPAKEVCNARRQLRKLSLERYGWITQLGLFVYYLPVRLQLALPMAAASIFHYHKLMACIIAVLELDKPLFTGSDQEQRKRSSQLLETVTSEVFVEAAALLDFKSCQPGARRWFCEKKGLKMYRLHSASRKADRLVEFCEHRLGIRDYDPCSKEQLKHKWPLLCSLLCTGLGDNLAKSRAGIQAQPLKLATKWGKAKASRASLLEKDWLHDSEGKPNALLFGGSLPTSGGHIHQKFSTLPVHICMLFAQDLSYSHGAVAINEWYQVQMPFPCAALLAASRVAFYHIMEQHLRNPLCYKEAKFTFEQLLLDKYSFPAASLEQVQSPTHTAPPPMNSKTFVQASRTCSMTLQHWEAMAGALRKLHTALMPYDEQCVDEAKRGLRIAWPACQSCCQDFANLKHSIEYASPYDLTLSLATILRHPHQVQKVDLSQVRFTHDSVNEYFVHGRDRGFLITDIAYLVSARRISQFQIPLDVVFWHGFYRSLNNRHLLALKMARVKQCCVRIWPMIPDLKILCGRTDQSVVNKFMQANTSSNDGVAACLRQPPATTGTWQEDEILPEDSVSRIDPCDEQSQLSEAGTYLSSRKSSVSFISAADQAYSDGEHRCYLEEALFCSWNGVMVGVRHLQQYDWIRAANGELTRVMSVEEHKEEERTLVTLCTGGCILRVTADHRVMVARGSCFQTASAGTLRQWDKVLCSNGLPTPLSVAPEHERVIARVFEIVFHPDLPVESYMAPAAGLPADPTVGAILTKGYKRPISRRPILAKRRRAFSPVPSSPPPWREYCLEPMADA